MISKVQKVSNFYTTTQKNISFVVQITFMIECMYCKSTDLEKDISLIALDTNVPGKIPYFVGPLYRTGEKHWLLNNDITTVEPMLVEICRNCGTTRLYIKDFAKDWCVQKKDGEL